MIDAPVPPPGSVIAGKYRVERVLGAGGMAVVVEATHMVLGQRVAIKLLRADAAQAQGVVERFRQEAQIAAQLAGDHIVRVTDVGQTERGEAYIVMELLVGRDLEAELLARGALPVDEAIDMLLQACEGVAEAHAAGLIHRDLKPGNLFVTRRRDGSPHVKVLDFGISKLKRGDVSLGLTQTTDEAFGTPLYMSPEQIQSAKDVDAASDQHALGAILYTLLAASPPYIAPSVPALSVIVATQPPPSVRAVRPDVPVRLDAAIARALGKKPSDRFRDLAELAHAIAPFGGVGSDAAVRRIASTLACAVGMMPPAASDPGYGAPPGYASSPGYGAPPGYAAPPASGSGSGMIPRPLDLSGSRFAQTSASLSSAVSGDRAGSSKKSPFALVIIGISALAAAVLVALLLARFAPRRGSNASSPADSAASVSMSAPVSAAASASTDVIASAAASASASAAVSASASAAVSASASAAVSEPASSSAPLTPELAASAPVGAPPYIRKPAPSATPRPSASAKSTTSKKQPDPAKVFGAKR